MVKTYAMFLYVFLCFGAADGDGDGSLAWSTYAKTAMPTGIGRLARGTCIRPRKWRTETAVRLEAEPAEMTMSAAQRLESYLIYLQNGGFNDV